MESGTAANEHESDVERRDDELYCTMTNNYVLVMLLFEHRLSLTSAVSLPSSPGSAPTTSLSYRSSPTTRPPCTLTLCHVSATHKSTESSAVSEGARQCALVIHTTAVQCIATAHRYRGGRRYSSLPCSSSSGRPWRGRRRSARAGRLRTNNLHRRAEQQLQQQQNTQGCVNGAAAKHRET